MALDENLSGGLVLLGCGKMGSALLAGWLERGLAQRRVWVIEPKPSEWLLTLEGINLNQELPREPSVVLIAVKPQMMDAALPQLSGRLGGALCISVAAGTPMSRYAAVLGQGTRLVRVMPNTPAAVGRGITALVGNSAATAQDMDLAENLMSAVGQTVRITSEAQMDAVTAVSGSGPAYVFHLIETLAAAGVAEGLPADLAMSLARATVGGAGHLAEAADETPAQLRVNVTSPQGTTAAALEVLMDEKTGFPALLKAAVAAAARRSRELADD
ncbi:MAG: pyrroline-5-carboxylate reductase [Pseudomonadota bacterium]